MDQEVGEVYFEHVRVGAFAKVSAIHAKTGIEISVTGPTNANPRDLERLALRKLLGKLRRA